MHRTAALALALIAGFAACGGGGDDHSGIDPSAQVSMLDPADEMTLCDWSIAAQGGAGHVSHCDGFDVTTHTVAECVAEIEAWTCDVTVAAVETCIDATGDDGCALLTEESCSIFVSCAPA